MTGRERITAALEGRKTDKVPVMIPFYDGFIARCGKKEQWEFDYGSESEQYQMQAAAIRRFQGNDGFWTWTGTNRGPVENVSIKYEGNVPFAIFRDGSRKLLNDDPANGMWNRTPDEVRSVYAKNCIEREGDITEKLGPVIPSKELLDKPGSRVLRKLSEKFGDRKFLWTNHSSLYASALNYLGGPEEGWIRTVTEPELVYKVLGYIKEQQKEYIAAAAAAGAHGLWHCFMNEGTSILSPEVWRQLVKPHIREIAEAAHECGLKDTAWFLDDCRQLVGDLIEAGIDGLATEQPRAAYRCEPGDLRKAAGDSRLCIFGWFWEEDLLSPSREELRGSLLKQYCEAGENGSFIVSSPGLTQEFSQSTVDMIIELAGELPVR